MKHIKPLALALGLGLVSLGIQVVGGGAVADDDRDDSAAVVADFVAYTAVEADRVYSFIDPHTKRITALLIANDRPTMTVSIDTATENVDLTAADGKIARIAIVELANAYAKGDAERRAAFLVSMQRKSNTTTHEPAAACDAPSCGDLWENEPTTDLASIVRWAVDNVGERRDIEQTAENIADESRVRTYFDPWQTATQVPHLLRSAAEFWRLWH